MLTMRFGLLLAVAAATLPAAVAAPPASSHAMIGLFKGRDLTHWYTFLRDSGKDNDPKSVFRVEDGRLIISGEEWGCITTEAEYENYYLFAEWRWTGKTFEP